MSNRSIFYGWWVVAAFSVTTFISTGIRHAVGPFLKPMVADLHLDRASFSLVIAVSLFLYGVFMPIAGMLLDRFSVRVVASVGTVLLAISLVMTAMVRDFWEFAAVYGVLVPLGLAGTGPVIASGVVARWFSKRRGTALSVLGSASMTGMSLLVPAVTWLILTTGWRLTYVVIAAGVLLLVLPLCLLVVRDSPESMGLTADGAAVKAGASAPPVERVTAGEALQTLAFWQLAGSFFTCGFSMSLLSAPGSPAPCSRRPAATAPPSRWRASSSRAPRSSRSRSTGARAGSGVPPSFPRRTDGSALARRAVVWPVVRRWAASGTPHETRR